MRNIWYLTQIDSDEHLYCTMKQPILACKNNCWFCSRLNGFVQIDNYEEYNKSGFKQTVERIKKAYETNKDRPLVFSYELTFNHKYNGDFINFFKECMYLLENECKHMQNFHLCLRIDDDNLLSNSVDLIHKYLLDIFPIYEKLPFRKEIRCEYSFDFDSRFYTEERMNIFAEQYNKALDNSKTEQYTRNAVSVNHFASILLPKTVNFLLKNWKNNENYIVKFIKNALDNGADLNFCLPSPMKLSVLQNLKNSYDFCDNYCYMKTKDILELNKLLNIKECPFLASDIDESDLFYCNLNGGCPVRSYCKRYQLRNVKNVNM